MSPRSYEQYCALALALDHIGDRWTLLIVRELLLGPRRYSDLQEGLPGIATNLLTERLRQLEEDGLVARTAPEGGGVRYELTEAGRALEPAVLELVRWGGRWMGRRAPGALFRPQWLAIALKAVVPPERLRAVDLTIELRVEGQVLHARAARGRFDVGVGPAHAPDLVITTDAETLIGIGAGVLPLERAVAMKRATVLGDRATVKAVTRLFATR